MGDSPKSILCDGRMRAGQWLAIIVTACLNALDGFDVLSISFASPGIAHDWGVDKATLGWALSMELVGMAVGSVLLGGVADRIGRRPTMLGCLIAMALGMYGAGHAGGIGVLLAWRLLTGLGIGGMLASTNAMAAEYSNDRWRNFAMALMVIGYPLGGVSGGLVVQRILANGSWHQVFMFGSVATVSFVPVVWFLVPESVMFLDKQRAPGALERINAILRRLGHPAASALSPLPAAAPHKSVLDILKPGLLGTTAMITFAYSAHIVSFYFILKWVPKIVVDLGFAPKAAAGVLTWVNMGGALGGAMFGVLATRVGLKGLTVCALVGATLMVVWFGQGAADLSVLTTKATLAGLFNNAGIAGLYLLFARVFPTHVRATGTGFAIGVGRGGAALAPVIAGYLFQAGFGLALVAAAMGAGSLLAAVTLSLLKMREVD